MFHCKLELFWIASENASALSLFKNIDDLTYYDKKYWTIAVHDGNPTVVDAS